MENAKMVLFIFVKLICIFNFNQGYALEQNAMQNMEESQHQ